MGELFQSCVLTTISTTLKMKGKVQITKEYAIQIVTARFDSLK